MRIHHYTIGRSLPLAALLMLFSGIPIIQAAENVLGEWEFTMRINGGGMDRELHPKAVFSQAEDGTISGTWEVNFQRPEGMDAPAGGDFQMPVFKLVDVKVAGQKLTFTQTGDMGGQPFEMPFVGTIEGDAIEGSFTGQFGEMAVTAARRQTVELAGDWEFKMTYGGGGGGMEREVVIDTTFSRNDAGAYSATWNQQMPPRPGANAAEGDSATPGRGMGSFDVTVTNINLEGNTLTFTRSMSRGDRAFESDFSGTIDGDTITGVLTRGGGRETPLVGQRKIADPLVGAWTMEMTVGGGGGAGAEMQFVIDAAFSKNDEGEYAATWEQQMKPGDGAEAAGPPGGGMMSFDVEVSKIRREGNKVTFTRKLTMGEREIPSEFSGTIEGDRISGTMTSEMSGEVEVTGTRKAE